MWKKKQQTAGDGRGGGHVRVDVLHMWDHRELAFHGN